MLLGHLRFLGDRQVYWIAEYVLPFGFSACQAQDSPASPKNERTSQISGTPGIVRGKVSVMLRDKPVAKEPVLLALEPTLENTETDFKERPPKTHIVTMSEKIFGPQYLAIRVGDAISYRNLDDFNHNVFSLSNKADFDLGSYPFQTQRTQIFKVPGFYKVYCNIHADMAGFVLVSRTDWNYITSEDGRFEIGPVPPGDYVIRAWSIRGGKDVPVVVGKGHKEPLEIVIEASSTEVASHLNKHGKSYELPPDREIY